MTELKTLNEIRTLRGCSLNCPFFLADLRKEAIKYLKIDYLKIGEICYPMQSVTQEVIKHIFNITDEDLK